MEGLNYKDVVMWLRTQSQKFARMAADIESTFGAEPMPQSMLKPMVTDQRIYSDRDIAEKIRSRVAATKKRYNTLALELGIAEDVVKKIVTDHPDLLAVNNGWVCRPEDVEGGSSEQLKLTPAVTNDGKITA